jgi:hypothetical protein
MTRPVSAIEAELADARASHQSAYTSHQEAVKRAADLRARVVAGDEKVSAADLATAQQEAEHRALPIATKLAAIQALEAEALVARTEAWADEVAATEPALRSDVDHAFEALEAVLEQLVAAWRIHAQYVHTTAFEIGTTVGANVTPRVQRQPFGRPLVQGAQIQAIPVHDRLAQVVQKTHNRLGAGQPKAQS